MSVCTFIASDSLLEPVRPEQNYPLNINVDTGEVFDGGADDNFFLLPFAEVAAYSEKKYAVMLEWTYTPGRAARIIDYIKSALENVEEIELWHVWLGDWYWYEYEERPVMHRRTVAAAELVPDDVRELDEAEIWNNKEKERPSFYCLAITR